MEKERAYQYGVEECADVVKYFKTHPSSDTYNIDPEKIVVMGYSAGGYHAMASVLALKKQNIDVAAQVLCYPYLKDSLEVYQGLTQKDVASSLFIICKGDPIGEGSLPYEEELRANGVKTQIKTYDIESRMK